MFLAGLLLIPVYSTKSATPPKSWPIILDPHDLPGTVDNAVNRLQTSAHPEDKRPSVNAAGWAGPSLAVSESPAADQRKLFVDEAESSDTSREVMTSPEVADDDGKTLIEKTLSQVKLSQSSGNKATLNRVPNWRDPMYTSI